MSYSIYDIAVSRGIQVLDLVSAILDKGKEHCEANDIDLQSVIDQRFVEDMLPFGFQICSVHHHGLNGVNAILNGKFSPPSYDPEVGYEAYQAMLKEALSELQQIDRAEYELKADSIVEFSFADNKIPFHVEDFVTKFNEPNLYFHATTTYTMLRMRGVPLGKTDFMRISPAKT